MKKANGILLASLVYYSGVAGTIKSFFDRAFLINGTKGNYLRYKVGPYILVVRRTVGIPTIDSLDI